MEIRIGDRVRFMNEIGGGTVTKVEKMIVQVKTEDGFIIPVSRNEVVVVGNEFEKNNFVKEEAKIVEKQEVKIDFEDEINDDEDDDFEITKLEFEPETYEKEDDNSINVCLAFVPQNFDDDNGKMLVYLVNDSNYNLLYNVVAQHESQWGTIKASTLEANTKFLIGTFLKTDLNTISSLIFQGILYKNNIYTPFEPIDETVKIQASRFFKKNSFVENDYFDENALIITFLGNVHNFDLEPELSKDELKKLLKEKNDIAEPIKPKNDANLFEIEEVDLHIEKLLDNFKGMSNTEILLHQMSVFKTELNSAFMRNVRKIVFIHGVGNGTLKNEIRRTLAETYTDYKFQDASFKEYGYGATLVYLK